jgi:hypothetical protein
MKTNHLTFTRILSISALLFFFSCEQEELVSNETPENPLAELMANFSEQSNMRGRAVQYECAQPASASASSLYWASAYQDAIDCDAETGWNSGGWAPSWYQVDFAPGKIFSGVYITSVALPSETQSYTVVATRPDNTTITLNDNVTSGDLSNAAIGGFGYTEFDFGQGFVEYKSVRISINGYTQSWKAIMEVELVVPDEPVIVDTDGDGVADDDDAFPNDPNETADTDGDGVGDNGDAFPNDASETTDTDGDGVGDNADAFPNDSSESADTDGDGFGDNGDAYPNSNMDATVVIGDCDSGVANQLLSDGATFNDLLGAAAMANTNHGHYVKAVSQLADTWKKAGLISGKEKGKITSCAARNK